MAKLFKVDDLLTVANSIAQANLDPVTLSIGTTVVNSSMLSAGANVLLSVTDMKIGNTTANLFANSVLVKVANSTASANLQPNQLLVGITVVNSTVITVGANVIANATHLFVGDGTSNVRANSTSIKIGSNVTLDTATLTIGTATVNSTSVVTGQLAIVGSLSANGGIGTANQALLSDGVKAYWGDVEVLGVSRAHNAPTANYTLALTDAGKTIYGSNAAGMSVTIPLNATVAFPIDTYINIIQWGAGLITVAPAGGVTLVGRNGFRTYGQYAMATLTKFATDTWVLGGDVKV
jgi:hypothetical protein